MATVAATPAAPAARTAKRKLQFNLALFGGIAVLAAIAYLLTVVDFTPERGLQPSAITSGTAASAQTGAQAPRETASTDAAGTTGCRANAHCTPAASKTYSASLGARNSVCFEQSMWEHLPEVGLQVSTDGTNFRPYPCTADTRLNGSCSVIFNSFKFIPADTYTKLPSFWYGPLGKDCN